MSLYQKRPIFSTGPREACEEMRLRAIPSDDLTDETVGFLPYEEVRTMLATYPPALDKAVCAAKERAAVRETAKKKKRDADRRVIAIALAQLVGGLPSFDLVGEDLSIAPGVFCEVTLKGAVRAVKRCRCGQEMRGVYLSFLDADSLNDTLADLGDLLSLSGSCELCGGGDDVALALAGTDEDLEVVIRHLYQAVGDDKTAWAYHIGVSLQKLEERRRALAEVLR